MRDRVVDLSLDTDSYVDPASDQHRDSFDLKTESDNRNNEMKVKISITIVELVRGKDVVESLKYYIKC